MTINEWVRFYRPLLRQHARKSVRVAGKRVVMRRSDGYEKSFDFTKCVTPAAFVEAIERTAFSRKGWRRPCS